MKTYITFACIYCGQHLECNPRLAGRQFLCPVCLHRIVIPPANGGAQPTQAVLAPDTWETHVLIPGLEVPTRYRHGKAGNSGNSVLAQAA